MHFCNKGLSFTDKISKGFLLSQRTSPLSACRRLLRHLPPAGASQRTNRRLWLSSGAAAICSCSCLAWGRPPLSDIPPHTTHPREK